MVVSNVAKLIKDRPLAKTSPDNNVREACRVMCELDARAVVVLEQSTLVGVLSERDVIQLCVCAGRHTEETKVSEIMTRNPRTIAANGSLAQALDDMSKGGFHHIPVISEGETIGLLSADDIPEEYRMMLERYREIRRG